MKEVSRVYVDVETTGLDPEFHSVVEVGAVAFSYEGIEVSAFTSLVNPGELAMRNSDPEAFEVNGIHPKEITEAPDSLIVAARFHEWLLANPWTIHAFPVSFDKAFLTKGPWSGVAPWGECVQRAAQEIMAPAAVLPYRYGKPKRPKLSEAANFFGVKIERAHRAVYDARAAAGIHTEILARRAQELADDEAEHVIEDGM